MTTPNTTDRMEEARKIAWAHFEAILSELDKAGATVPKEMIGKTDYFAALRSLADAIATALSASEAKGRQDGVREGMRRALEMRTGDHVHHMPSGETWVVAWADYSSGYMSACGWPECEAKIADCAMVKKATDEECAKLAHDLATSGRRDAHRAAAILSNIEANQ